MLIGVLQLEITIGEGDKRRILRSLKDKWHHHHNVSVAEVDYIDSPTRALLGICMIGSDAPSLDSSLSKLVEHLKHERLAELVDYQIEIISGR